MNADIRAYIDDALARLPVLRTRAASEPGTRRLYAEGVLGGMQQALVQIRDHIDNLDTNVNTQQGVRP